MAGPGILTETRLVKPWGRCDLPQSFDRGDGAQIGEVWFDPPEELKSVLAKYLFTGERLSVQIHPLPENSPTGVGKDECWLITEAKPGATLAIGFREEFSPEDIRAAALDGSIEDMLDWREVKENDFLYVPSGTVHAIGPGLTLVEIQQNSDITYRLYDYGRDRDLHLDDAMRSIDGGPYPDRLLQKVDAGAETVLVDGPYFRLVHSVGMPSTAMEGAVQVLPLSGACRIGGETVSAGASGWASELGDVDFSQCGRCLLIAAC
ncbi:class I mannose-6-phosphate isomerase [Qipengyuania sp. 1NDH10]|nr:class I mannose-6-phosphate isomerase [Qipengyuania vesicularis]